MKTLARRSFLFGAAGASLALPFLDIMRPKKAHAATAPRRIIFSFKSNGDQISHRFDTDNTGKKVLGEFLSPLTPYQDELLFINRLDKRFENLPTLEKADQHQQGTAGLAPWSSGEGDFPYGEETRTIGYVLGPSADYVIGQHLLDSGVNVPYRHLVYRVGSYSNDIWTVHSHGGPDGQKNPISPEVNPYAAYTRLFGVTSTPAELAQLEERLKLQRSLVDLVKNEASSLQLKVGVSDQQKIERHLDSLRDLERSLQSGLNGASCNYSPLAGNLDAYEDDNHAALGELFFKLIAMAYSCDLSRVTNFAWSGGTSNRAYRNLGISDGHHDISHRSDEESFASIRSIHKHLWTETTKHYDILKATADVDGSLWDNTLIVHWNELGQGDTHTTQDQLVVLAGGHQGYFKRGEILEMANQSSFADMLISSMNYMGMTDTHQFGDKRLSDGGGIPNILS